MRARTRVLFLCTNNSARSQIGEGLLRFLGNEQFEVFSAGRSPTGLHPLAVQVMREIGIDIVNQRSKHLREYLGQAFDLIITVCDDAREHCPAFPGDPECVHWTFADPEAVVGDEEARLRAFRKVRDELCTRLRLVVLVHRRRLHEQSIGYDSQ